MIKEFQIAAGQAVFGIGEFTYQKVLDDFSNASFIGIVTFNISPRENSHLLNALKQACQKGANATIVTNIPKRFPSYCGDKYAIAAKKMIELYKRLLNPNKYGMQLNTFFKFENHAKIIMTENIIYWGSSNYSDESKENFECGTISTDKELIDFVTNTLFPYVTKHSIPYYKYNYAIAIANLDSLIPLCKKAYVELWDAAFEPWSDYDTNFEEKWIYRTTDNDVTVKFLRGFIDSFLQFDEALEVIEDIIDDYCEAGQLPNKVAMLQRIYEDYKCKHESFLGIIDSLFRELEQMAGYDTGEEACKEIINNYAMEAIDEELDYYIKKTMNKAAEEYGDLIRDAETPIKRALSNLKDMRECFEQIREKLFEMLEIDSRIDNTHVR